MSFKRRLPIGAEVCSAGETHFRVWAPGRRRVDLVLEPAGGVQSLRLEPEGAGYFAGWAAAGHGGLYRFRLDDGRALLPDPASRFQPDGPFGASLVIDPARYRWGDAHWGGVAREGQVIYEMHVGTFTHAGTWDAATAQLEELAALGITVIEVMPVADFAGGFGWGYDGVNLFAPTRLYGEPDHFRRFVDRAHLAGIGVILDVVYNHLGSAGNFLKEFAPAYFTDRYKNDWGEAINFDGPDAAPVREFFLANAGYWIDEFHLDGLRLDATQQIFDRSEPNILAEIVQRVRQAAGGRRTFVVAENEPQRSELIRPADAGGHGADALWNDDFHHSAMVALTGRNEAYYSDYLGTPQEFISAAKWGFLYQGQYYSWQKQRRGAPALDLSPAQFVCFIQNHDQVANSGRGLRCQLLTSPGRYRAMSALLLLGPWTPLLFQGQEFAASTPFFYFADHDRELAPVVARGRAEFLAQFPSLAQPEMQSILADPSASATFERSRLDFSERRRHAALYNLHKDLLMLRRAEAAFRQQRRGGVDGAVLGAGAFVLRFFGAAEDDRLLLVNLGRDLHLNPAPEPLLAPLLDRLWGTQWSSEDVRYGGNGTTPLEGDFNWRLPGEAAVVLCPRPQTADRPSA